MSRGEFRGLAGKWVGNPKVELDEETFRFVPKFPKQICGNLSGVGERYLTHPHFEVWQDYIRRWYEPPKGKLLLFLPCSKTKPYSDSETHKRIADALKKAGAAGRVHEVMLSNAGIVPREFEDNYPFNAYDWDEREETPEIKRRYIEVTAERIRDYLRAHQQYYLGVGCYLKHDSESYTALTRACEEVGVECRNLLAKETYDRIKGENKPLQNEAALAKLKESLVGWLRQSS
jgi:predicted RNA-binding protein